MEKLQIKNFAGLKDVTIEVKPITGFIGPQASGKSIIAKLLYFFREISSRLPKAMTKDMDDVEYQTICRDRFIRYFPIGNTAHPNFDITYWSGNEKVTIIFKGGNISGSETLNLEWSGFFPMAIERLAQLIRHDVVHLRDSDNEALDEARERWGAEYDKLARNNVGRWSTYEQIFIPAGRGFFTQFNATVFSRLEAGDPLEPFMVAFGSWLVRNARFLETFGFYGALAPSHFISGKLNEMRQSELKKILRGEIFRLDGEDYLRFDDGRRVKLAQASSGQQEILPLLLLLLQFLVFRHERGRAVYIEEPEAHLFPSTQKQIVELIAETFRARGDQMKLALTTHSPYILTSINNLLQAGKLYEGATLDVKKRLESVIPLSRTLKPGEVAFYALENGEAKSIIDPETGLIDAAVIDSVSDEIATQFDELLLEGNEKR